MRRSSLSAVARVAAGVACAAFLCAAAPDGRAQTPLAPPAPPPYLPFAPAPAPPPADLDALPPRADSALAVGVVDVSIAGTLIALGVLFEHTEVRSSFMAGGAATAAIGIPLVAAGAGRVRYARESEAAFATGAVLASMGATISGFALGAFVGAHLQKEEDERFYRATLPEPPGGNVAIATGVGMAIAGIGAGIMVFGALERSPEQKQVDAEERARQHALAAVVRSRGGEATAPRSVPRRTAGQVLTAIGIASGVGAVGTGLGFSGCSGDFCGFIHLFTTLPLAANSVLCTSIGVPLWVSGASEVPIDQLANDETWLPEVAIGAGNATVTMRF